MKKNLFLNSLIIFLIFISLSLSAHNVLAEVKINEILFNPNGIDTGQEWIELYNNSNENVNIGGYELNATSGDYFQFPPNTIIPPHQFIIVWWRKNGINTNNEFFTSTNGFTNNMGNSYGWVALFKNSEHNKDTIVDYIEYGKSGQTWEGTAFEAGIWQKSDAVAISKTEGISLGRKIDGADQNNSSDWQEFSSPTPNLSNNNSLPSPTPVYPTPIATPSAAPPSPTNTPTPLNTTPAPTVIVTPPLSSLNPTMLPATPMPQTTSTPSPNLTFMPRNLPSSTSAALIDNQPLSLNNQGLKPTPSIIAQKTPSNYQFQSQAISATSSQNLSLNLEEEKLLTNSKKIQQIKKPNRLATSLIFQPLNAIISLIKSIKNFILQIIN